MFGLDAFSFLSIVTLLEKVKSNLKRDTLDGAAPVCESGDNGWLAAAAVVGTYPTSNGILR